jgi:hypothetical protein
MKLSTSTKALLIAALAIVALFLIGDFLSLRTNSTEPRTHVMDLDPATVVSIHFEDRADAMNDFLLRRGTEGWERTAPRAVDSSATAQADELLRRFELLKVKRDMGMIRLLGERYFLTDSTLCRITFTDSEQRSQALNLGSSTFAPGKVGSWTYVNIPGEREVYAIEGLLSAGLRIGQESSE